MAKCGFSHALKSNDIFDVGLRDDLDMVESTRFRFLNDDFSTTALFANELQRRRMNVQRLEPICQDRPREAEDHVTHPRLSL